jgi:transcriptional regulator
VSLFVPSSDADVLKLIRDYPLAWLVTHGTEGFGATPLPLLAETDSDGALVSLFGHMARSNPQVRSLDRDRRAAVLFQGPQGYVSPRLVSNPTWGPTWNYATAKFEVEMAFVPEENDRAIRALGRALEGDQQDSWTPERMGERYDQLRTHIVAFRAKILSTEAKFKLGQDEKPETFAEIVRGIGNPALAEWMHSARAGRR